MKVAITGGTGFVGRNFARKLLEGGHEEVVLIARGRDERDSSLRGLPGVTFAQVGLDPGEPLRQALADCEAVAHCAGINREIELQTYRRVHVEGTRNLIEARPSRRGAPDRDDQFPARAARLRLRLP